MDPEASLPRPPVLVLGETPCGLDANDSGMVAMLNVFSGEDERICHDPLGI